jgi:hypothetical protein
MIDDNLNNLKGETTEVLGIKTGDIWKTKSINLKKKRLVWRQKLI